MNNKHLDCVCVRVLIETRCGIFAKACLFIVASRSVRHLCVALSPFSLYLSLGARCINRRTPALLLLLLFNQTLRLLQIFNYYRLTPLFCFRCFFCDKSLILAFIYSRHIPSLVNKAEGIPNSNFILIRFANRLSIPFERQHTHTNDNASQTTRPRDKFSILLFRKRMQESFVLITIRKLELFVCNYQKGNTAEIHF